MWQYGEDPVLLLLHPRILEVALDLISGSRQIDLVGFVCILAHDQLRGLFPKGATPTAEVIRTTAYAK